MRELEVRDPDGNVICFGEDTDPTMDYSSTNGPNSFIDIPRNWTTD